MTSVLNKSTINTWEWLDAYCLSKREDVHLACGQHGILVVQIDNFDELRKSIGEERTEKLLKNMEEVMAAYALEDTLIARYNPSTFAVILHFLAEREEIEEIAEEIREAINMAKKKWEDKPTVSVGAAECHHDVCEGYKCATLLAMEALKEAKEKGDTVVLAEDTLPLHPLAIEMKKKKDKAI